MRILHVIPYFPPAYAFGGPVVAAYQICRELARRGHGVTVWTTDVKDRSSRLEGAQYEVMDGVEVYRFRVKPLELARRMKLFVTPSLVGYAKRHVGEFDVIHLHEYYTFQNVVVSHYARKRGVPYVLQPHGSLAVVGHWRRAKALYNLLFGYRLLRGACKVLALTRAEATQAKRMGVPESRIAVVPLGIDLTEYSQLPERGTFRKRFGIPDDKKIALG